MEQLNKVDLRGIVGNVRIQDFDETRMAKFGLATNYCYKDRDQSAVIETSWHNIVAWEGRKISLDRIEKGAKLHVIGRLRYQNYVGVDGVERRSVEILASEITVIDKHETLEIPTHM